MQNFKKLDVWHRAHSLSKALYLKTIPVGSKDRNLMWQCRKSCFSISFNIAEGCGRHSANDQAHFFQMARGSASELECQLLLIADLGFVDEAEIKDLVAESEMIQKMLHKLIAFKRSLA